MAEFFQCIPLISFDTSSLTSDYQSLNGTGFITSIRLLKMINNSTSDLTISYDGVNDNDIVPAGSAFILDLQANHETNSAYGMGAYGGRKGQIVYGKGSAGTGNFYIIGYV